MEVPPFFLAPAPADLIDLFITGSEKSLHAEFRRGLKEPVP
jgi:hypothetical protein